MKSEIYDGLVHVCFLSIREEMSKDCLVRIVKLDPSTVDNRQQKTSKTESASINLCSAVDEGASTCDTVETLQKQSKTDAPNVLCQDATRSMNDLMNSPTSDDDYLVIVDENESNDNASNCEVNIDSPLQTSRDDASGYEVDIDLPSRGSCGSEESVEKLHEQGDVKDAYGMCLSCVGTSAMQTIKTNRQYQPFVRLKSIDPAELSRWRAAKKSESRVQGEDHIDNSKYVICFFCDK